jgi:hypothetical protein
MESVGSNMILKKKIPLSFLKFGCSMGIFSSEQSLVVIDDYDFMFISCIM